MRIPSLSVLLLLAACSAERAPAPPSDAGPAPEAPKTPAAPPKAPSEPSKSPSAPKASSEPSKAASTAPEASPKEASVDLKRLEDRLRALVITGAREDGFPWALAHGLAAFGPALRTDDGRLAVDAIAEAALTSTVGGVSRSYFPVATPEGLPLEPHPDLMVLALVDAGVPLPTEFALAGGVQRPLSALVEDAEARFSIPDRNEDGDAFAWSARLFLGLHSRPACTSSTAEACGPLRSQPPIELRQLAEAALARVEAEQAFLLPLMKARAPERVVKRKQGIFAHTCGGLHLLQAGLLGAKVLGTPEAAARAKLQLDVLHFRWEAERRIYRETLEQHPEYAPLLLVQELKFFGHTLETLAWASAWGLLPKAEAARRFALVAADLARTVPALEPLYAAHEEIREIRPQTYNDLIGDGCHAIRGLAAGRALLGEGT